MKTLGFWRHFEEVALEESLESSLDYGTQTRQREEPDQRNSFVLMGTKTLTETREEPDQDKSNEQFCAIPKQDACGTMTQTFTREESDQDEGNEQFCAIPPHVSGWETFTKTREEPDQDESDRAYAVLPVNSRVEHEY